MRLCACLHDARKCFIPFRRKVEDENNLSTIIDEFGALKAEIADLPAREKSTKETLGDLEAGIRSPLPHYASQTVFERADQIIKNRSLAGGENHVRGHSS